jgi:phospholipid/cholesterol/gamma-HCH transport system substrate-binding protein
VNQTARDFMIGLCSIIACVGFAVLLIRFGELRTTSRYQVTIPSVQSAGIRTGSSVTLNGVKVGVIESVEPTNDPRWPVLIIAGIDAERTIPNSAVPYSSSSLLGTGAALLLDVAPADTMAPALPSDGTAVLQGPVRSYILATLNDALDQRLNPVLDSFNELSATYISVGENLQTILGPTGDVVHTVQTTLARINGALEMTETWLGDEELQAQAHDLIGTSIVFVNHGIDMVDQLTELTSNIDEHGDALMNELLPVSSELTRLLATTDRVMQAVEDGEGTIGQLVTNRDLYDSLDASMKQLQEAIVSFTLLVEQLREEGVF